VSVSVCVCVRTCMWPRVCVCAYVWARVGRGVCWWVCVYQEDMKIAKEEIFGPVMQVLCEWTHKHPHTHTFTHTYTHTHPTQSPTHTHTDTTYRYNEKHSHVYVLQVTNFKTYDSHLRHHSFVSVSGRSWVMSQQFIRFSLATRFIYMHDKSTSSAWHEPFVRVHVVQV